MNPDPFVPPRPVLLPHNSFDQLIHTLKQKKYRVLGPKIKEGAVKYEEVSTSKDLPIGWKDDQSPGQYWLTKTSSQRFFDIVHGPESLKRQTFAPRETLLTIEKKKKGMSVTPQIPQVEPTAILGIRSCDIAGLQIQDRIFLQDVFPDPYYQHRRESLLLIAVNCTRAHETCFCASMNTGPKVQSGYDIVLTESDEGFVMEAGSPRGQEILQAMNLESAPPERLKEDEERIQACATSQTRTIDQTALPQALYDAHDHPRWDEVATRCLACTNCTMVCPTCFCHKVEETPNLSWDQSEHVRVWDSCFTSDHGYIHGKNFRPTTKDRYRMWLTHKLASWIDQFGSSGCVGCGRCITWCPVGIDITEELQELLKTKDEGAT